MSYTPLTKYYRTYWRCYCACSTEKKILHDFLKEMFHRHRWQLVVHVFAMDISIPIVLIKVWSCWRHGLIDWLFILIYRVWYKHRGYRNFWRSTLVECMHTFNNILHNWRILLEFDLNECQISRLMSPLQSAKPKGSEHATGPRYAR